MRLRADNGKASPECTAAHLGVDGGERLLRLPDGAHVLFNPRSGSVSPPLPRGQASTWLVRFGHLGRPRPAGKTLDRASRGATQL